MMCRNVRFARHGLTLLEVVISVTILGVTASVATMVIRRAPPSDPTNPATVIADTLERVLATGARVTLQFTVNAHPALATINPDGSIVADSALAIERLTGRAIR